MIAREAEEMLHSLAERFQRSEITHTQLAELAFILGLHYHEEMRPPPQDSLTITARVPPEVVALLDAERAPTRSVALRRVLARLASSGRA